MLKKYRVIFISLVSLTLLLVLTAAAFYLSVRSGAQKTPIRHVDLKPFHSLKIIDRSGALLQEVRCRDGRSSPVKLKNISPILSGPSSPRKTAGFTNMAAWTGGQWCAP